MKKSTYQHLRFNFSYFLLPVFLFALAVKGSVDWVDCILTFIVLHFLVYPASNGFNSYFDKDKGPIGGLENPPAVSQELYYVSLGLDAIGLIIASYVSIHFAGMIFIYGLISKAYSHPMIRLKKHAFVGWVAAGFFQGYFTFIMTYLALSGGVFDSLWTWQIQVPAWLTTLLLFGSYPMTQVYQHGEDRERGDFTISLKLGILGTFHFTAIFFLISVSGFFWYFNQVSGLIGAVLFIVVLVPVLVYFFRWYFRVRQNLELANFRNTMNLNLISATMLNLYFFLFWLNKFW